MTKDMKTWLQVFKLRNGNLRDFHTISSNLSTRDMNLRAMNQFGDMALWTVFFCFNYHPKCQFLNPAIKVKRKKWKHP